LNNVYYGNHKKGIDISNRRLFLNGLIELKNAQWNENSIKSSYFNIRSGRTDFFLISQNYQSDLSTAECCPSIESVDRFIKAVACGWKCQLCCELCNSLNLPGEKPERWISFWKRPGSPLCFSRKLFCSS